MWMAVMQQLLKQIMAEVRTKDPVPMLTPVTAILPAMVMLTDLTLHHSSQISAEVHTKPPVPPARQYRGAVTNWSLIDEPQF
jgi:hypothetical protein